MNANYWHCIKHLCILNHSQLSAYQAWFYPWYVYIWLYMCISGLVLSMICLYLVVYVHIRLGFIHDIFIFGCVCAYQAWFYPWYVYIWLYMCIPWLVLYLTCLYLVLCIYIFWFVHDIFRGDYYIVDFPMENWCEPRDTYTNSHIQTHTDTHRHTHTHTHTHTQRKCMGMIYISNCSGRCDLFSLYVPIDTKDVFISLAMENNKLWIYMWKTTCRFPPFSLLPL